MILLTITIKITKFIYKGYYNQLYIKLYYTPMLSYSGDLLFDMAM